MFTTQLRTDISINRCLLLAMAIVLGLLASTLWGATISEESASPPKQLPASILDSAKPMPPMTGEMLTHELWQVLEDHHDGRFQSAIDTWEYLSMPPECEVWRQLGLGAAFLKSDQLEEATEALAAAEKCDKENAVTHYFKGLLSLRKAVTAREYPDALLDPGTRLASWPSPQSTTSKPKSRHELEAIQHLETSLKYANSVDLKQTLVPVQQVMVVPYPMTTPHVTPPTVGDLLHAFDADNFVGKAHSLLADLYLDENR